MFIWSLFVGAFLDRNQGSTRTLLVLTNLVDVVDILLFIANALFYQISNSEKRGKGFPALSNILSPINQVPTSFWPPICFWSASLEA